MPLKYKMKRPTIQIHDGRRTVRGDVTGTKYLAPGYRVKTVAKNGEILQSSQVLDTYQNVIKHCAAMSLCWNTQHAPNFVDRTKRQIFAKKGFAIPSFK